MYLNLLRIMLLFAPGGEGGGGTDNPDNSQGAGNAGTGEGEGEGGGEKPKMVPLEKHKAKVTSLENQLKEQGDKLAAYEKAEKERNEADMTEVERLKARNQELENKLSVTEVRDKKLEALKKAKRSLGDGLTIDDENAERLEKALAKLQYDPATVDEDVADLVKGFARPASSGYKTVAGKSVRKGADEKQPMEYTDKELGALFDEDPEKFRTVMAERKKAKAAAKAERLAKK